MAHKNQHEWDYVGRTKEGNELSYCDLCKKIRINIPDGKHNYTIISKKKFEEIKIPGSENW